MSLYQRYLVCYDIVNTKTRTRFADTLKDLGLFPVQKSVFIGELNQAELRSLIRYAQKHLDPKEDKAFWLPTLLDEKRLQQGIGYAGFTFVRADGHACI
jgi:CRISPR-associated protein Cas2